MPPNCILGANTQLQLELQRYDIGYILICLKCYQNYWKYRLSIEVEHELQNEPELVGFAIIT